MFHHINMLCSGHTGEIKDEELFTIDTAGDLNVKRQLAKDKPLRVDEILQQRSAVPAVQPKNPFKKQEITDKVASKHESDNIQKILKRKGNQQTQSQPKKKKVNDKKTYDLWGQEEPEPINDFLPTQQKPKTPETIKQKPAAAAHIPAIETPHAGASYNPEAEQHQQLLAEAVKAEERKAEIIAKLHEQLSYREELKLLASEDAPMEHEDDEDVQDLPTDDQETKKMKAAKRKTRRERHKKFRLASEELARKQKLHEKAIRRQIDQLREIEAEIEQRANELDALLEKKEERKASEEKKGIKKLGKYEVPELPIDVQLTDELCATLRQLKPEGSIFKDRFHSLVKRNIIEPRVPVTPTRRYKLKEYEKRSYKKFDQMEQMKKNQKR
ncbi:hypothetical protein RMATCC62417_01140 [Rhizopus microsporus]|nr:hypothetical protein RMATCC62417_01140 [Rhizopus microsporus]CEI96816.1 hypothetical protein RMCBS344292_10967 [Rhizopus microsporus]